MKEETHRCFSLIRLADGLLCLLSDPGIIGAGGATGEVNTTRARFDEEEHVQRLQVKGFNREEIARKHLLSIVLQHAAPRTLATLRRRQQTMTAQDVPDGRWIDGEAEFNVSYE